MKGKEEVVQFTARSDTEWALTPGMGGQLFQGQNAGKKNTFGRGGEHQYKSHFLPSSCHMCSWIIDHADIHLSNTHNLLRDESIKNYTI